MKRPIVHKRSVRMFNNAGMAFPVCYANATLLDIAKVGLLMSPHVDVVTCKRCLAIVRKDRWA